MQDTPYVLGWSEPGAVAEIARVLRAGGVAALPTETLYGFSCLARSEIGMRRVMRLKGIDRRRGFVALVPSAAAVAPELAPEQDPRALAFLGRTWPAALTAVLRTRRPLTWGETHAGRHTAAFRVPAHAELLELLRDLGEPVLSTSLNRTGSPPLVRPEEILQEFGDEIDLLILDDVDPERQAAHQENEPRAASSLADFTSWPPRTLRRGDFDLQAALGAWEAAF
jgi:L-threonylcarbamoyladenylate synthase